MEEEGEVRAELAELIESFIEGRDRASAELEELRAAVKVVEKYVRRLERQVERYDTLIKAAHSGRVLVEGVTLRPRNQFTNMSIPDAAAVAIRELRRPLHARDLAELLEAGGKRFNAARPAVSIASALSRDARFVRVGPNTFDLVERTQPKLPID